MNYNFEINSNGEISQLFLKNNCFDFHSASEFIRNLPYRRNLNKDNLATVFIDEYGTCSTKHALLKILAEENNQPHFKLILGIFKMNGINTPKIKSVFETLREPQSDKLGALRQAQDKLQADKAAL